MADGIRQPAIGIVLGVGEVERRRREPSVQPRPGPLPPVERSTGHGLALAVHHDRAVCGRAAEETPPGWIRVGPGPRIDQERFAKRGALYAQQVGVAVASAGGTAERA